MHPGGVGPGGEQHLKGRLPGAEGHHQLLPVGLVDLVHPAPQELLLQLFFDVPQKTAVQCHSFLDPFSVLVFYSAPMGGASPWDRRNAVPGMRLRR